MLISNLFLWFYRGHISHFQYIFAGWNYGLWFYAPLERMDEFFSWISVQLLPWFVVFLFITNTVLLKYSWYINWNYKLYNKDSALILKIEFKSVIDSIYSGSLSDIFAWFYGEKSIDGKVTNESIVWWDYQECFDNDCVSGYL